MDRRTFILGLLLVPVAASSRGRDTKTRRCRWLKARIRLLDARLRAGNRGTTTRRLRGQRLRLAKQRFSECR